MPDDDKTEDLDGRRSDSPPEDGERKPGQDEGSQPPDTGGARPDGVEIHVEDDNEDAGGYVSLEATDDGDVLVIDGEGGDDTMDEVESLFKEALQEDGGKAGKRKGKPKAGDDRALLREKAMLSRQIESFSAELYNLRTELNRVEEEKTELIDQVKRTQAELVNFRKRIERDKETTLKYAAGEVFEDIIPVVDNFERALSSAGSDVPESYKQGIDMIYQSLLATLKRQGLQVIEAKGKPFDPNIHEAMMRESTTEHKNNEVIEELQTGYMFHDRLLRPARVKVAYNESEEDASLTEEAESAASQEGGSEQPDGANEPSPGAAHHAATSEAKGDRKSDADPDRERNPLEDTLKEFPGGDY